MGKTDFLLLNTSCNTENTSYAAETLLAMHQAFEEVYGEGYVDESYGMVMMPAVVKGELTEEQKRAIGEYYLPYDYWYTPLVEHDHHVNFTDMPEEVVGIRRLVDEYLVTGQAQQMEGPK